MMLGFLDTLPGKIPRVSPEVERVQGLGLMFGL